MTVVTRIAPSPTGDPHVGTAYVGLFNYALARKNGGRFVLRIEDTDRARYDEVSEGRILEMMRWLGITPDEGPEVGGENGPYRQSERLATYREHVQRLLDEGKAYRAFETEEELERMRLEQKRRGQPHQGYDGSGRGMPREEQERRAAAGEPHVVRLVTPDEGETVFRDGLRGDVPTPNTEVRDAVLLKSDGYPTYHLANVVDDRLMGVTDVMRAEEWISSTALHVLLYRAFGWELPRFWHLPLLRNPDKSKISKRKMDTSVDSYREQGFLPEALLNFLATMGWSMPDGREIFTLEEMIEAFDPGRLSPGEPVFDLRKLRHVNGKYLREVLDEEDLARRVAPLLRAAGFEWSEEEYLLDVVDVLRPRAEVLTDFVEQAAYFFRDDYPFDEEARKRIAGGQKYLEDLERELSRVDWWDFDELEEVLNEYIRSQEVKKPLVLMPLRAALTGVTNAPGVTDLMLILGKPATLARIGRALGDITAELPDDHPEPPKPAQEPAGS